MKKIKLLLFLSISFCLVTLATLGVFALSQTTEYSMSGFIQYEITEAMVNISTAIYKANSSQSVTEINNTIDQISSINTIPSNITMIYSDSLQTMGETIEHVDDISITFSEETPTYYLVVNIENRAPSVNTWAIIDDNTELPENVELYTNSLQQTISSKKNIVYALNMIDTSAPTSTFKTKVKIGINELVSQDFNLKKLIIEDKTVSAANTEIAGTVIVPEGVTTIKANGFQNCKDIRAIILPSSLTTINSYAFNGCEKLQSISIPEGVTTINSYCFQNCSSLTNVEIPSTVDSINVYAFDGCKSLDSVYISSIESWLNINFHGHNESSPLNYANKLYLNNELLTSITVPETVLELQDRCLMNCIYLQEVVLHDALTTIGEYAFYNCSGLVSINIPASVTTIERCAFYLCSSLDNIILSDKMTNINESIFSGCSSLTAIEIPNTIVSIGNYAFYNCNKLKTVTFKEGSKLSSIGGNSFRNCASLENFDIPKAVTTIQDYVFYDCVSLKSIVIPDGITSISNSLFYNCGQLESVKIPDSVTTIKDNAFFNCGNLKSIEISENITSIGSSVFTGCFSLTRVDIKSIESWFKIAFTANSSNPTAHAKNLYLNGETVTDIIIPNTITTISPYVLYNCINIKTVEIPNTVTRIGREAFYGCSNLTSVTIPEEITINSIEQSLFYECSKLKSVQIPKTVTSISASAFFNCNTLESVKIPEDCSITSIGNNAFYKCYVLADINIPETVTSIGSNAFYDCFNLKKITIKEGATVGTNAFYDCYQLVQVKDLRTSPNSDDFLEVQDLEYTTEDNFKNSIQVEGNYFTYSIKDEQNNVTKKYLMGLVNRNVLTINDLDTYEITDIYPYACYNNIKLEEIVIPDTVTTIGSYAFYGCNKVFRIKDLRTSPNKSNLPTGNSGCQYTTTDYENSYETEDNYITYTVGSTKYLYGLANNTVTQINDLDDYNITAIYPYAFADCTNLQSITIPANITAIPNYAFYGCKGLKTVTLYEGLTTIGDSAFYDCTNLINIQLPNTVNTISNNAFYNCTNITDIVIPEGVVRIGVKTFYNCKGLESVSLPNGLLTIGTYSFSNCSNLKSITIPSSVTIIDGSAFRECSGLTSVSISDIDAWTKIRFGGSTSNPLYYAKYLYLNSQPVTKVTIPDDVTNLSQACFVNCITLEEVELNNTKTIGNQAFSGCNNLSSIIIPSSVTSIGANAFSECNGLISVEVEENTILSLKDNAFYICSNLQSVSFPESCVITSLGNNTFYGCKNLSYINLPKNSTFTSTGNSIFYQCSSLVSVVLPNNVKVIERSAFNDCKSLENVLIPNSVTTISTYAFCATTSLTSIQIPSSVTSIGESAFYKCSKLTQITYSGTTEQFNNINVADNNLEFENATLITNSDWTLSQIVTQSTCLSEGVGIYVNVSGEEKEGSIEKLPHNFVNGTCCQCHQQSNLKVNLVAGDYGFENDGSGMYFAKNINKDSSTAIAKLTATADTIVTIKYSIDTESGFDKFTITVNGVSLSSVDGISGLKRGEVTLSLVNGDVVEITYVKDETTSSISDYAKFSITS